MQKLTIKVAFLAIIAFFTCINQGVSAQCTPDLTFISASNYPAVWKTGCVGQAYTETVYISFPIDSVVSGVNVIFDYFKILSSTLPPGLTYSANVANDKWTPTNTPTSPELMFGCINISGTPTAPYSGNVTIDIEGCGTVIFITQCSTEVLSFQLDILEPPVPVFSATPSLNTVSFNNLTTPTADSIASILWIFGDGNTSTDPNPTHTYTSSGIYNTCLSMVTVGGCNALACDSVTVLAVGVDPAEEFARSVEMFPNPATEQVQIRITKAQQPVIELRSIDGRLIRDWNFSGGNLTFEEKLDISGIEAGLYFLNVRAKEGNVVKTLRIE